MKVCVGVVEYGDPQGLNRLLGSLALGNGGMDGAIIIHGRFANFPRKFENAFEETIKVIDKHVFESGNVNIHCIQYPEDKQASQIEMRNAYLDLASKLGYDWLLVMDSDEYITPYPDWKAFRETLEFEMSLKVRSQIYDVMFTGIAARDGSRPRLFYRPGTIRYWKKHYWFILNETQTLLKGRGDAGKAIGSIYLTHDKTTRNAQHVYAMMLYENWLEIRECSE